MELLRRLSAKNNFHFHRDAVQRLETIRLAPDQQQELAEMITDLPTPSVYVKHVCYTNFTQSVEIFKMSISSTPSIRQFFPDSNYHHPSTSTSSEIRSNGSSVGTTMFERHGTMWNGNKLSRICRCPIRVGCERISKRAFCKVTGNVRTMRAKRTKELVIIEGRVCSFVDTVMSARKF